MFWLVLQTFLLVAAAMAIGVAIGIAAKLQIGRPRPALAGLAGTTIDDDGLEAATPPPPQAVAPLPETGDATGETPEGLVSPPSAADGIIDAAKAGDADQVGVRPPALPAPRDRPADDLKVIKGIGPQNETRLNALGIFHLAQIAAWTPEEARWVGAYLAFPGRIEREDWVGQARLLAPPTGTP